jgi:hypothetical protein
MAADFGDLRACQLAYAFKLSIYRLIDSTPIAGDFKLRDQLREAASPTPSAASTSPRPATR